jgi:2-oxoglutarate ferredoxin oxidoreductase subunit alpha
LALVTDRKSLRANYLRQFSGQTRFIQGDAACAYGALYGGCDFFAGYPITPASEIAEVLASELPNFGGYCIQMEDEIASVGAMIGAVWAGAKAMTATSGPGFSLMQENIGYAIMTETPCVIVDVQRSGPSTGQATLPAQGDIMQARWGTHGDHEMIALAPASVQECLTLTADAFNLAEEYRNPVIVLMDGEVGHLREKVVFPNPSDIKIKERRLTESADRVFGGEAIPPMAEFGHGSFVHITGSTHKETGMRDVFTREVHEKLVRRIYSKIDDRRGDFERVEERFMEDAEIAVVSMGVAARPAMGAVRRARDEGRKVGFLRLLVVWPFPDKKITTLGTRLKKILVPEMNLGQLSREIERFVDCEVVSIPKIGGVSHTIEDIYSVVEDNC